MWLLSWRLCEALRLPRIGVQGSRTCGSRLLGFGLPRIGAVWFGVSRVCGFCVGGF